MAEAMPLDATFGWLYIGMTVAMALWGVGAVQTWWYYDNYPNDPRILKGTVALTFICDTIHQILITYAIYIYVIKHFGDTEFASSVDWSLYVEILFNAFTAFFVQSFFTWRIWTLWKNVPLTAGIVLLVLSALGTSIAFVAQGMSQNLNTFDKFKELQALSMVLTAAVTDIAICIAMCVLLNASKTGFSWSNHIINRLMLFAINSGILTAACATASLIFILALPNTLVYFCFYLTIGRLYTNSILATLNARAFIRNGGRSTESEGNSRNMPMQDRNPRQHRAQNSGGAGITVQIETTRDYDDKFTSVGGGLRESTRSDENVKGYPLAV
ncbi:hypothetical protein PM082_017135 [Marasmius tenuissimus]|nr:hypothetical protein PM082_017135 [Marasmius tenuissimus]